MPDQCQVPDLRSPCHSASSPPCTVHVTMSDGQSCRICGAGVSCRICGRTVSFRMHSLDRNYSGTTKSKQSGPMLVGNKRSADVWPVRFLLRWGAVPGGGAAKRATVTLKCPARRTSARFRRSARTTRIWSMSVWANLLGTRGPELVGHSWARSRVHSYSCVVELVGQEQGAQLGRGVS